ncbi:MAG: hypothetical protein M3322_11755, partial [Actinomycetota bacterium]|nr:hypothetical protein [Actinomycetota bacterium]
MVDGVWFGLPIGLEDTVPGAHPGAPRSAAARGRSLFRLADARAECYHLNGMPAELPTGTVTFLFTDIEGSTG